MSRLMQMAELMIRGGIATQTMANLTPEQIERVDEIVKEMTKDPQIAADRVEMCRQLGNTIGGDYRSDRNAALQEFRIALWRATVYLLYHRQYKYNCTLCGATEYITGNKTIKIFDRQYAICPKCNKTFYEGTECNVVKREKRHILVRDDVCLEKNDKEIFLPKKALEKIVKTPIAVVYGANKYENAEEILADKIQRRKWYKTWVWNYFKQILNENSIKTHNRHQIDVAGPADEIVTSLIVNELKREKRKFFFDRSSIHMPGEYFEISVNTYQTEPNFTRYIALTQKAYEEIGVRVILERYAIKIKRFNAPVINAVIVTEEPVIMMSNDTSPNNNDDSDNSWKDAVEYHTEIKHDGEIEKIESEDAMHMVKSSLADDITQKIFDIYSQQGVIWEEFSDKWGEHPARKLHISNFLGITTKEIEVHRNIIKTQCLAHSMVQ